MSTLEQIVRPFQRPDVNYPLRAPSAASTVPSDDVIVQIGKEGAGKLVNESFSQSVNIYNDVKSKETSRSTSKKRIENPDDSSQFVDVELINKLGVEQGSGRNYQKIDYEFNNK